MYQCSKRDFSLGHSLQSYTLTELLECLGWLSEGSAILANCMSNAAPCHRVFCSVVRAQPVSHYHNYYDHISMGMIRCLCGRFPLSGYVLSYAHIDSVMLFVGIRGRIGPRYPVVCKRRELQKKDFKERCSRR